LPANGYASPATTGSPTTSCVCCLPPKPTARRSARRPTPSFRDYTDGSIASWSSVPAPTASSSGACL